MAEIPLTRGLVALIDDADLPLVSGIKWHAYRRRPSEKWYARSSGERAPGSQRRKKVSMHKFLMPGVPQVDHKNGDGLDNRRSTNLRPATGSQNQANKPKYRGTSRFKGVRWHQSARCWYAQIKCRGQRTHLGAFKEETDAARAYNAAALALFGEFAWLNEIEEPTS